MTNTLMNWNITSKEIIRVLKIKGWLNVDTHGDHWQFKHKDIQGKVTVPHPKKTLGRKTIKSILNQAALTPEEFIACLK
jgi:predicted RNA binding protein YcfA (HicA-like mRNA interferase family)